MKNVFLYTLLLLSTISLSAQYTPQSYQEEGDTFVRKGRFMIETGYNLVGGFGTGTGLSILAAEGESITSLGFDGGYMLSENFALTFKLGLITGDGASLTNIGVGGKYYIAGKVPVSLSLATLSTGDDSTFLGNLSAGYAINLADNITLEPALGIITTSDDGLFEIGATFAMFL